MKKVQRRVVQYTGPGIYVLEIMPHGTRGDYAIRVSLASASGLTLTSIGLPDATQGAFSIEGEGASLYAVQNSEETLIVGEVTGLATLSLPVVIGGTSGSLSLYVDISILGRQGNGNGNGNN